MIHERHRFAQAALCVGGPWAGRSISLPDDLRHGGSVPIPGPMIGKLLRDYYSVRVEHEPFPRPMNISVEDYRHERVELFVGGYMRVSAEAFVHDSIRVPAMIHRAVLGFALAEAFNTQIAPTT